MNKVELSITVIDDDATVTIKGHANDVARAWYSLTKDVADSLSRVHGTKSRDELMALCGAVLSDIDALVMHR